jgi:DNA-binding MarR family transcriptional regulator
MSAPERAVASTSEPDAQPRISYIVGRVDRTLSRALEQCVAEYGLTLPQYTALSVLKMTTGLSNAQLARRTFVRPQSMILVISALERQGLIARSPAEGHRRILRTSITPAGKRLLARCDRSVNELEHVMLAELSVAECEQLRLGLMSCARQLRTVAVTA